MSIGLGVDIVEIERISGVLARSNAFVSKVYTEAEQLYCNKRANPALHYAACFAAKEAAAKALGTGFFTRGVRPSEIEVTHDAKGKPQILLHSKTAALAKEQGVIDMPLSLSHTHAMAVANVAAITKDSIKEKEQRSNSASELAKRFKDARALIDEISSETAAALE